MLKSFPEKMPASSQTGRHHTIQFYCMCQNERHKTTFIIPWERDSVKFLHRGFFRNARKMLDNYFSLCYTLKYGHFAKIPVTYGKRKETAMKLGMVGLPNVGKSTLFNALTNAGAESANYPFCTIEKNVGIVSVPDARLDKLAEMYEPDKFTPATLEFVDIAGLVKGASKGEGLGNKFLGDIREVDAIVHVVRCFEDDNIIHVDGRINPASDIETINLELIFSDMEMVARRIDRTKKALKGDKKLQAQVDFLERLQQHLEEGRSARGFDFTEDELDWIRDMPLLSAKPVIYAANMSEEDFRNGVDKNAHYQEVKQIAEAEHAAVLPICAKIEEDIADMDAEDKSMFLEDLGLEESGLNRIIREGYALLGLISYLTAGKQEVRAWTITKGTKAPQAAGKIHTDFEKGFIRAEVVSYDDLMSCGSMIAAKEKGLVRLEGKEYVMQDGDIVLFRFNV
jgi:GTP-binding protein YchF